MARAGSDGRRGHRDAVRRRRPSSATRCWRRSAARRPRATSASRRSGSKAGGYLSVDDSMRVHGGRGGWLYATGDANGRNLLTHMGKYQAGSPATSSSRGPRAQPDDGPSLRATADALGAPQVVFTDPEVCAVGADRGGGPRGRAGHQGRSTCRCRRPPERPCRPTGIPVRPGWSSTRSGTSSWASPSSGQDTAELIHSATVAVVGEVPLERLWHAVTVVPDHQRDLAAAAGGVRPLRRCLGWSLRNPWP